MIGQVPAAADAMGSLSVGPTQEDDCRSLVSVLWSQPVDVGNMMKTLENATTDYRFELLMLSKITSKAF